MNLPARHTLYGYIVGVELADGERVVVDLIRTAIEAGDWHYARPCLVNQQHPAGEYDEPDDLPLWDLGLNMRLPEPGAEPVGWVDDLKSVLGILAQVFVATGRDSVVGIHDATTGITDDLFSVRSPVHDFDEFRTAIGAPNEAA